MGFFHVSICVFTSLFVSNSEIRVVLDVTVLKIKCHLISVFGLQNNMVKSLAREGGSFLHRGPIAPVVKLASTSNRNSIIPYISAMPII
jgi:hypothetical protein